MHPKLYCSISKQVLSRASSNGSGSVGNVGNVGELQSPENAAVLLSAIARELFRVDITWGKVNEIIHLFLEIG